MPGFSAPEDALHPAAIGMADAFTADALIFHFILHGLLIMCCADTDAVRSFGQEELAPLDGVPLQSVPPLRLLDPPQRHIGIGPIRCPKFWSTAGVQRRTMVGSMPSDRSRDPLHRASSSRRSSEEQAPERVRARMSMKSLSACAAHQARESNAKRVALDLSYGAAPMGRRQA